MERAADFYIGRLARLNRKNCEAFLDGRMMSTKLELLKMFGRARLKDTKERNAFSDLIRAAIDANTDRNTVIHGVWSAGKKSKHLLEDLGTGGPQAVARKRTSPGNYKTMSAHEIDGVARALNKALWLILLFAEEHWPTAAQKRGKALAEELRRRAKK
jgi:hypothetical protein